MYHPEISDPALFLRMASVMLNLRGGRQGVWLMGGAEAKHLAPFADGSACSARPCCMQFFTHQSGASLSMSSILRTTDTGPANETREGISPAQQPSMDEEIAGPGDATCVNPAGAAAGHL